MNRFTIKHWVLCLAFFIPLAFTVNALTLNPLIEAPKGHTLINQEPLLFNEQIIFVTQKDDIYTLWAYDLTNHSYTTLQTFEDYFYPKFYVIGDYFYFKDSFDPNIVWQSDGTPQSMMPMGTSIFYQTPLYQRGDLIFARGGSEGGDFIVFDGQVFGVYVSQLTPLNPDTPSANLACGFSIHDVIYTNQPAYGQRTLIRQKPGNDDVDYTSELPVDFHLSEDRVWYIENTCFYHIIGHQFNDILVIPEQGDHYFLGETIGFEDVSYITYFKDHFYAIGTAGDGSSQILKLSSDLSSVENHAESASTLYFTSLTVSDEYLIALADTGPLATPTVSKQTYFDENLIVVEGLGGINPDVPEIYTTHNGETVVFNDYINGLNLKNLTTDITNQSSGLVINGDAMKSVITNEDTTETYVLMWDLHNNQSSIQKLEAIPDMGALSVGNWFDPDYQNQGMSIVEGLRNDGTRYLFVTLYLFQDGQPLWLAGTSNINYPQPTLDIELGAYNGLGLWQADTPANVEKFADMTLSMSGCHQMMMNLETMDGQNFNIELQRMVNNDINHVCKDE